MSNKCTFSGRVVYVGKTEKLGSDDKPFYKRTIIVDDSEVGSKYPNEVPFEYTGDKCKYLDHYKVGDEVDIDFFPSGRRWHDKKTNTDKWFGSFRIGFIKKIGEGGVSDGGQDSAYEPTSGGIENVDDSDVPF